MQDHLHKFNWKPVTQRMWFAAYGSGFAGVWDYIRKPRSQRRLDCESCDSSSSPRLFDYKVGSVHRMIDYLTTLN